MSGEEIQIVRRLIQMLEVCGEDNQKDAVQEIERYLKGGGNPNGGAPVGAGTLLASAVSQHNLSVCKCLLDHGADPNFCGRFSRPPLHVAAKTPGHMNIFTLLLDAGANMNLKFVNGNTPLLEAIQSHDHEKVRLMIDRGADITVANNGGDTGLHMAAISGNDTICRMLLDAGLPVNVVKYQGPKKVSNTGIQPLHNSAVGPRGGHGHITRLLLQAGADPDATMANGRTTLHLAAMRNAVHTACELLQHGCQVDIISMENEEHKTPLMKAIDNGHLDMVRMLIDAGADLETEDKWGCAPLVVAVFNARVDIVVALLQAGADVHHRARNGLVPLDFAVSQGKTSLVTQMLVLAGCSLPHDLRARCIAPNPQERLLQRPDLLEWLCVYAESPRPLMMLCRRCIRHQLGTRPCDKLQHLPVPPKIQTYLNFSDIVDLLVSIPSEGQ